MPRAEFLLTTGGGGPLREADVPAEVRVPLACHRPLVSAGDAVLAGQKLAEACEPGVGDAHSPLAGVVAEAGECVIAVRGEGQGQIKAADLSGLSGQDLAEALRGLGLDTAGLVKAEILVVNAAPPDIGACAPERLLSLFPETVALGLEAVKSVVAPKRTVLVMAHGLGAALKGCEMFTVPPYHPNGVDGLAARAALGRKAEGAVVVSAAALFHAGRIMETGLPLTEIYFSLGNGLVKAAVGSPLADILPLAGLSAGENDRLILGGLLRGQAARSLDQGLPKGTLALCLVPHGAYPPVADALCLNCGECVLRCPARIMPNMISRCAEFRLFERARQYHLEACVECGLCGYFCPSRRPILQYIQLAKFELAALDRLAAEKAAQEEAS